MKEADTQEQCNMANKKSRSSMLEECLWQRGLVVLLAACSCELHAVCLKSTSSFSWTGTIYREPAKTAFLDTQQRCWLSSDQRIGLASGNRAALVTPLSRSLLLEWLNHCLQGLNCRATCVELKQDSHTRRAWQQDFMPSNLLGVGGHHQACVCGWSYSQSLEVTYCLAHWTAAVPGCC